MTSGPNVLIEVCVESVASALVAERGGADRIELCSSLIEGGVTPSAGLIETVRAAVSLPLHVMIRPRGGDFCYDPDEFEVMRWDIMNAKKLRANGVVFGILCANGEIDLDRTSQLVELARPLSVTFHRAFDMTANLFRALEDAYSTGVDRILTSGGESTSLVGSHTIAQLVNKAAERVVIMPGSGIKTDNAAQLVRESGAKEIHVGLRTSLPSPMSFRNPRVSMGSAEAREYQRFTVLEEDVRNLRIALTNMR
jgi:copper homeostasis protein